MCTVKRLGVFTLLVKRLGVFGNGLQQSKKHLGLTKIMRLPNEVGKKMFPILKRLTDDELLQRCRRNRTQNSNESLHNLIWQYCPKIRYAGRYSVEGATCLTICQFSLGATFREMMCRFVGIDPGYYLIQGSLQKSSERLKMAEESQVMKEHS